MLDCTICYLPIKACHIAPYQSHLLSDAHYFAIKPHDGANWHCFEVGDVERACHASHELPETRPSNRTQSCGRCHVKDHPSCTTMHDIFSQVSTIDELAKNVS